MNCRFVILGALLVLLPASFFIYSIWSVRSPAVPEQKLKEVRVGMTQDEVLSVLGKPRKSTTNNGVRIWIYGHPLKWFSLQVRMTPEGYVEYIDHDD